MYDQSQSISSAITGSFLIIGIFFIAVIVFAVIIYWKIFAKAGYNGAMGLLMFVPIANLIMLCILAFGEWPIYRELNQLRQQVRGQYPPQQQYMPPFAQPYPPQQPSQPQYPPMPNPNNPQF